MVELLLKHLPEAALADLVLGQAVLGHVFVEVFHQDDHRLLQLRVGVRHLTASHLAGPGCQDEGR